MTGVGFQVIYQTIKIDGIEFGNNLIAIKL